jgi:ribonuclease R
MARYRELVPLFERMRALFEILNTRRHRRGSIDFDLKEPELVLDDAGMVEAIVALERNVAHRIIEEFMLVANETVAQHLAGHEVPTLFRVHEDPDPLKVEQFQEFIATLGYSLAAAPDAVAPRHFQKLVERMRGTPEEKPIAFLMLRTMQKARYDPQNLGHFGLAAESYAHFTSPIRRYPDLVVHRALRELRHGRMTRARLEELEEDLPEMARHTSDRERRADDAERELLQWKKVRFMADKVGDEFTGYITGVTAFGLFIELVEHFVEGLVHISTMANDYYRFVERAHILRGENTGREYRLGDRVTVQVIRVDMERRQVDLGLVEILDELRGAESGEPVRRGTGQCASAAAGARTASAGPAKGKVKDRRGRGGQAGGSAPPGRAGRGRYGFSFWPSCVASLKFRMPRPMPRPISGRRFAPKIRMMMKRMTSSSGMPRCGIKAPSGAYRSNLITKTHPWRWLGLAGSAGCPAPGRAGVGVGAVPHGRQRGRGLCHRDRPEGPPGDRPGPGRVRRP